ncbi:hypothetical protein CHLRE_08g361800v5 [Chlamydomonas reinhardtii]|uniref:DNA-directed RNA polymerase III subunit n=1 Tax=Chlamydomonas reinhardtii TaxID=3055 RepID=A0A2K3DGK1_CHLRE|nr:uncharacterized protein CHLRE_08g361800v5 [Chlamydomonas reinhardtii]PNW79655.1 hypothetical protein CHLRE_08g361800v5 [Chlamydomonas reinhardtii]
MSGRGGGRGGRGGGRFGGRGGAPMGPVARDEDGTILATAPAGPPPLFPETELPEHPEITAKDKMLLLRRFELSHRSKFSPYFLELPKSQKDTGALDEAFDPYKAPEAAAAGAAAAAAGGAAAANGAGPSGGAAGAGAGAVAAATAPSGIVGSKRSRPPLSSVMTLIPDYFPEDLYTSKDMRASRLQTLKGQDAYFRAQARGGDDATSLKRLEQLAKMEGAREGEEGGGAGGRKGPGGEGGDEEEGAEEEQLHDTDEEEDMEDDDYYQGEHFDDDEGYGDAFDEGGDEGPVY